MGQVQDDAAFREIVEGEGFKLPESLKPASEAGIEPCADSRYGNGFDFGDDVEWNVDSVHAGDTDLANTDNTGFVGLRISGYDDEEGITVTMTPEAAQALAHDLIAVAVHVDDADRATIHDKHTANEARAAELGYFQRLVDRGPDEQPDDPYYGLDGRRITYPKKWVPCGRDDEGAYPDVQAMFRAEDKK